MFVEDNSLVVDFTINNKVRLDGEESGNGAGVGDVDNECTELEMVNKRNKDGVRCTVDKRYGDAL